MEDFDYLFKENVEIIHCLKELPLFGELNEVELGRLAPMSETVEFEIGEDILTEGQANNFLYVLLDGRVKVLVGGEYIVTISRQGDLLGEMSVISSNACSATLSAETPVRALRVDADSLKSDSNENLELRLALYRIFALILTDKLNQTNQKAKQFEEMARELSIAKDELKVANESVCLAESVDVFRHREVSKVVI